VKQRIFLLIEDRSFPAWNKKTGAVPGLCCIFAILEGGFCAGVKQRAIGMANTDFAINAAVVGYWVQQYATMILNIGLWS